MKKIYYRIEDDCVSPIVMEKDEALVYIGELMDGISVNYPIKVTAIEMEESKFSQLPEFEGN